MKTKQYHIIFEGQVQGVGFRYTTQKIANPYKLCGYVKNLNNGNVELKFQATPEHANPFIQQILTTLCQNISHHQITASAPTQNLGTPRTNNLNITY